MSSQGPTLCGTGADNSAVGLYSWNNPGYIISEGGGSADVTFAAAAGTHYLQASNFSFTIPTGATINGFVVEVKKSAGTTGYVVDQTLSIVKSTGVISSTNEADTTTHWPTSGLTWVSYGGVSDLMGYASPSYSDVNSSTFGAVLATLGSVMAAQANVDAMRITVYYTGGGGGSSSGAAFLLNFMSLLVGFVLAGNPLRLRHWRGMIERARLWAFLRSGGLSQTRAMG